MWASVKTHPCFHYVLCILTLGAPRSHGSDCARSKTAVIKISIKTRTTIIISSSMHKTTEYHVSDVTMLHGYFTLTKEHRTIHKPVRNFDFSFGPTYLSLHFSPILTFRSSPLIPFPFPSQPPYSGCRGLGSV